jgi:transmembrane sensor
MMADHPSGRDDNAALEREAIAWLTRVTDEAATQRDHEALRRWQARSDQHARAFAKASRIWQAMPSAIERLVQAGDVLPGTTSSRAVHAVSRRALVGGLATAAAAGFLVVRPPLDLWPSFFELVADYRTGTGQQRRFTIAAAASVEMNTKTSIALRPTTADTECLELVSGEAIIGTAAGAAKPIQVIAADGLTTADAADFDVRCNGARTIVTCISGSVRVEHRDLSVTLRQKQQVSYGAGGMSSVTAVDPAVVTSWRDGFLMFRKEPLVNVIDEVNRYRPGRIVLLDRDLGQGLVTARFKLDRLDDVVAQVREVFGAKVRTLPGGIVLIG